VFDEPPLEKAYQEKNSRQIEKRQLNFQRKVFKVISFTSLLMIYTKGRLLFIMFQGCPKGQSINKRLTKLWRTTNLLEVHVAVLKMH